MAPLHALEDLDDALDATTRFLRPIDRSVWLKLALVALFIGGPGANANSAQWTFGGGGDTSAGPGMAPGEFVPPDVTPRVVALVALAVAFAVTLAILFGVVGSIMEFVFVQSLRTEDVRVREYWSAHWRKGLRLFGFRLALGLFVLGSVLVLAVPFLLGAIDPTTVTTGAAIAFFLLVLPVFAVLAVVVGVVNGFTTVFVVPIMLLEDCGVLAGWRRLWPTIKRQPLQYLAYLVASFFLGIVGGVLVAVATGVLALVLLVPFGVLFALGGVVLVFVSEGAGIAILVVVGVAFALCVIAVAAVVQVPVQTYLRYYAMLVLGDVDPDLDAVPEQRTAVRHGEDLGDSVG